MGTADAAKVLGVSRWTVLRAVKDGEIATQRTCSGQHIYAASEIARVQAEARRATRQTDAAPAA